jgi:hypothetical protein
MDFGAVVDLYGMGYENNAGRLNVLRRRPPLLKTRQDERVCPAILIPDPSRPRDGIIPVAVCAVVGYVGSTWSDFSTLVAADVDGAVRGKKDLALRISALRPLAFQADCAGSIPVTRSTAASRETGHWFPATPFFVRAICGATRTLILPANESLHRTRRGTPEPNTPRPGDWPQRSLPGHRAFDSRSVDRATRVGDGDDRGSPRSPPLLAVPYPD